MTKWIPELIVETIAAWLVFHYVFELPLGLAWSVAIVFRLLFTFAELAVFAVMYVFLTLFIRLYEWCFEREHVNAHE